MAIFRLIWIYIFHVIAQRWIFQTQAMLIGYSPVYHAPHIIHAETSHDDRITSAICNQITINAGADYLLDTNMNPGIWGSTLFDSLLSLPYVSTCSLPGVLRD